MRRLLMLFLFSGLLVTTAQESPAWELLRLINEARTAIGLPEVAMNSQLVAAAQRHSDDMAVSGSLSHVGADGSQFWERVADSGYEMTTGAENVLARGDADAAAAFQQWGDSPPHYANMVNPAYTEMGVAFAIAPDGTHYFTLVLASRTDPPPPTATPEQEIIPSPTAPPTSTPLPLATSTPTLDVVVPLASVTPPPATATLAPPSPTAVPVTATPIVPTSPPPTFVTFTPTPAPDYDLRLIYDSASFTIKNVRDAPLYLEGLSFQSGAGGMAIERWDTEFLSAPLAAFPAGDCLQAWGLDTTDILPAPAECEARHGWVAVNDEQIFWRGDELFTVYLFGEPVTVCPIREGVCDVLFTQRLEAFQRQATQIVPPVAVTQASNSDDTAVQPGFDVQLVYSPDSFALINTSGGELDLTGLAFAGSGGALSINAWNIPALSRPLGAFPSGDCVQAWPLALEDWPWQPEACNYRHAWVALNDTETFWLDADFFTVNYNGGVLATCNVSQGLCEFDLPG